jgi:hypothetical protein
VGCSICADTVTVPVNCENHGLGLGPPAVEVLLLDVLVLLLDVLVLLVLDDVLVEVALLVLLDVLVLLFDALVVSLLDVVVVLHDEVQHVPVHPVLTMVTGDAASTTLFSPRHSVVG